jgi:hypothetical protein
VSDGLSPVPAVDLCDDPGAVAECDDADTDFACVVGELMIVAALLGAAVSSALADSGAEMIPPIMATEARIVKARYSTYCPVGSGTARVRVLFEHMPTCLGIRLENPSKAVGNGTGSAVPIVSREGPGPEKEDHRNRDDKSDETAADEPEHHTRGRVLHHTQRDESRHNEHDERE